MATGGRKLEPVLSAEEIRVIVSDLGRRISEDFRGRRLVLVGVLRGAFVFLADLARALSIPVEIDFLQVSSYGDDTVSSGRVHILLDCGIDLRGKDVLLVEDIAVTGRTLRALREHLLSKGPARVAVCALIDKRERREHEAPIDYAGCVIEGGFLVGYGLDCAQQYRHLPGVYRLVEAAQNGGERT